MWFAKIAFNSKWRIELFLAVCQLESCTICMKCTLSVWRMAPTKFCIAWLAKRFSWFSDASVPYIEISIHKLAQSRMVKNSKLSFCCCYKCAVIAWNLWTICTIASMTTCWERWTKFAQWWRAPSLQRNRKKYHIDMVICWDRSACINWCIGRHWPIIDKKQ